MEGGHSEVGWFAGGVAIFAALFARLRRPKALRLEDKHSEVDSLSIAVEAMERAIKTISARLEVAEAEDENCQRELKRVEKELLEVKAVVAQFDALFEEPIPAYTKFKRMKPREE